MKEKGEAKTWVLGRKTQVGGKHSWALQPSKLATASVWPSLCNSSAPLSCVGASYFLDAHRRNFAVFKFHVIFVSLPTPNAQPYTTISYPTLGVA